MRTIESLITQGMTTAKDLQRGMEIAGFGVIPSRTIHDYVTIARERLNQTDSLLCKARRELFLRELVAATNDVRRLLRELHIDPSWNDLIALLRLQRDSFEASEDTSERSDQDVETAEQLDAVMREMLPRVEKLLIAPEEPEQAKTELPS